MTKYRFTCQGHPNILATHATTLEFTKDPEVTLKGDCIVGVNADYSLDALKHYIHFDAIQFTLQIENEKDSFTCKPQSTFNDAKEMVIRLGNFESDRTFGIHASKAAKHIKRELISLLRQGKKLTVAISESITKK